ncbi:MAG: hypothetical protein ACRDWH_09540 [Acidimicrobiia bacterium]
MIKHLLSVCLLCLLCACGGSGTTTTEQPSSTTSTTATESTTTTVATGAAEECVVGDWVLDADSFADAMESIMSSAGAGTRVNITAGGGTLSFGDDGGASGGYDSLTIEVNLGEDLPGMEIVMSGDVTGNWSLEGDTLVFTPAETSNLEVEASVGGQSMPVPIDPQLMSFGSSRSTISCAGDELTIEPEVEGAAGTVWLRA